MKSASAAPTSKRSSRCWGCERDLVLRNLIRTHHLHSQDPERVRALFRSYLPARLDSPFQRPRSKKRKKCDVRIAGLERLFPVCPSQADALGFTGSVAACPES